ncbi:MAG: ATP-binding protein [Eubacteriales bacterium]|nr:ATP-binding protein [Eubacteriales bacterium]
MKVITEAILRDELRCAQIETYVIPEGKILSPAAREYLQQQKIKIVSPKDKPLRRSNIDDSAVEETPVIRTTKCCSELADAETKPKYVDDETGAFYFEKPEHMTQLTGNRLVTKDDKRILFRGKLDSLEALFVLNQTILLEMGEEQSIVDDLEDVLTSIREMMRCDVLDEPYTRDHIIGLDHAELRDHSHHPMKYYKVKQMVLPSYKLGKTYALLNQMRTAVRETEVAAATAFHNGKDYDRTDIIEELNRMSSAMHILMCKQLAKIQNQETT